MVIVSQQNGTAHPQGELDSAPPAPEFIWIPVEFPNPAVRATKAMRESCAQLQGLTVEDFADDSTLEPPSLDQLSIKSDMSFDELAFGKP